MRRMDLFPWSAAFVAARPAVVDVGMATPRRGRAVMLVRSSVLESIRVRTYQGKNKEAGLCKRIWLMDQEAIAVEDEQNLGATV